MKLRKTTMMNCEPENDQAEMKSKNDDATSVGGFKGRGLSSVASHLRVTTAPVGHAAQALLLDLVGELEQEEQSDEYADTDDHAGCEYPGIVFAVELQVHEESDNKHEFPE